MYFISKIDYRIYKKFDKIAYAISALLLLAVLIPGIRWEGGGAARWLYIRPLASYLTDNRENLGKMWEGFFKPLLWLAVIIGILVVFQSHLSASILIIAVVSIMMLMAGSKFRYFLIYGSMAGARRSWNTLFNGQSL